MTQQDQPKAGPMWLCRGCEAALVSRGVFGSGYCRECYPSVEVADDISEDAPPQPSTNEAIPGKGGA